MYSTTIRPKNVGFIGGGSSNPFFGKDPFDPPHFINLELDNNSKKLSFRIGLNDCSALLCVAQSSITYDLIIISNKVFSLFFHCDLDESAQFFKVCGVVVDVIYFHSTQYFGKAVGIIRVTNLESRYYLHNSQALINLHKLIQS